MLCKVTRKRVYGHCWQCQITSSYHNVLLTHPSKSSIQRIDFICPCIPFQNLLCLNCCSWKRLGGRGVLLGMADMDHHQVRRMTLVYVYWNNNRRHPACCCAGVYQLNQLCTELGEFHHLLHALLQNPRPWLVTVRPGLLCKAPLLTTGFVHRGRKWS